MRGFGDLEGAIMERVWSAGRPLLVREIQQALEPERAYNTVQTVTEILCRKGWLAREKEGRAYRYRATVTRDDYTGDLMGEALAASSSDAYASSPAAAITAGPRRGGPAPAPRATVRPRPG